MLAVFQTGEEIAPGFANRMIHFFKLEQGEAAVALLVFQVIEHVEQLIGVVYVFLEHNVDLYIHVVVEYKGVQDQIFEFLALVCIKRTGAYIVSREFAGTTMNMLGFLFLRCHSCVF